MKKTIYSVLLLVPTLLVLQTTVYGQTALGTEFTYQGRLNDEGFPADGQYDFVFRLYDAITSGSQVGGAVTVDDWSVEDGLFTLQLDFGTSAFGGDARWIEVDVRVAGTGDYTTLSPRQPVTAAPVALYALGGPGSGGLWAASGDDIYNSNAGGVGIGTTAPASLLDVQTADGTSVWGTVTSTTPGVWSTGVRGQNNSTGENGIGVWGSQGGSGVGVFGNTASGRGVMGECLDGVGVWGGISGSTPGAWSTGVRGENYGTGDDGIGVWGSQDGSGVGVFGNTVSGHGVMGACVDGVGVWGGISGSTPGAWSTGVRGENSGTGDNGIGVWGSQDGSGVGVFGYVPSGRGVFGESTDGVGVYGGSTNGYAGYFAGGRNYFGGNVGIGTTDPAAKLHVSTSSDQIAQFTQHGTSPGVSISLTNTGSNYSALSVYSSSNNAPALSVTGTARVDVLEIYGADVAERFPVSEETKPGMVVMIDAENPGNLCLARGAYNRRVAGVVSGAGDLPAGTILGNLPGYEDAPAIALSGRVWVHCDASNAAIEPGDLLTTSDTPGHAMVAKDSSHANGAVIGKAMTTLPRGETGLVLVLVNLQ